MATRGTKRVGTAAGSNKKHARCTPLVRTFYLLVGLGILCGVAMVLAPIDTLWSMVGGDGLGGDRRGGVGSDWAQLRAAFVQQQVPHGTGTHSHSGPPWKSISIDRDFGAIGDNATDNTNAFRAATRELRDNGGGELIVPSGGVYQTAPFNLSSNVVLTVHGTIRGVEDQQKFPKVDPLPSYGRDADFRGKYRRHPFVWASDSTNITIRGTGTLSLIHI